MASAVSGHEVEEAFQQVSTGGNLMILYQATKAAVSHLLFEELSWR
jgi:hypothetical protein